MGYYMRFFDTAKKPLTLRNIRTALRRHDRLFELDIPAADPRHGILRYAGVVHAEIDLSEPGDGTFEDEIAERLEAVASASAQRDWKTHWSESTRCGIGCSMHAAGCFRPTAKASTTTTD